MGELPAWGIVKYTVCHSVSQGFEREVLAADLHNGNMYA